jgi:hypothetical protein
MIGDTGALLAPVFSFLSAATKAENNNAEKAGIEL